MKSGVTESLSTIFPWAGFFYQKPMNPVKGPVQHSKNSTDRLIWLITYVVYYGVMMGFNVIFSWIHTEQQLFDPKHPAFLLALAVVFVYLALAIDETQRWLLLDWLPRGKAAPYLKGELKYLLSWTPQHICMLFLQTYPLIYFDVLDWHYDTLSLQGMWKLWKEWLLCYSIWNVVNEQIAHVLMHNNKKFLGLYEEHKSHHIPRETMTLFRAYQMTAVDFFLELNYLISYVPLRLIFGVEKMHWMVWILTHFTIFISCHGCNPYMPDTWNPIMDYFLKGGISHHLHHACNRGHYSIIPWHHFFPSGRQRDIDEYNKVMKTDYYF